MFVYEYKIQFEAENDDEAEKISVALDNFIDEGAISAEDPLTTKVLFECETEGPYKLREVMSD